VRDFSGGGSGGPNLSRHVSPGAKVQLLFGGFVNQFGWCFLGFGMIFVWLFLPIVDLSSFSYDADDFSRARGEVLERNKTSSSENKRRIYEYRFVFDIDGQEHHGTSYRSGRGPARGASVAVEYLRADPTIARIEGQRLTPMGPILLLVLVFPIVGGVFVLYGFTTGTRALSLLANGCLTEGKFEGKEPTGVRINRRRVYRMIFSYQANDGRTYRTESRTHETEKLEDDELEQLIYDPSAPSNAILLDKLPGNLDVSASAVVPRNELGSLAALILPGICVLGHGAYLLGIISF